MHVDSVKESLISSLCSPVNPLNVKVYQKIVQEDSVTMSVLDNTSKLKLSSEEAIKKLTQVYKHIN